MKSSLSKKMKCDYLGKPSKMNFLLWECWKGKIAKDDGLIRMRVNFSFKCYCCESTAQKEIMTHLFLTTSIGQKL